MMEYENTITKNIIKHYKESPNKVALKFVSPSSKVEVNYNSLYANSYSYATKFNSTLDDKSVIIIILKNSPELIYSFLGGIFANKIPTMFPHPSSKISSDVFKDGFLKLIDITGVNIIVTYPEFAQKLKEWNVSVDILTPEEISMQDSKLHVANEDEIAFLQHSSGTTGLKKGVALSHKSVINQIKHYSKAINLNSDDKIVSWLPLYHDMGLIANLILPIVSGVSVSLIDPFDWVMKPDLLIRNMSEEKATLSWLPNFSYLFMAKRISDDNLNGVDLGSIRGLINCAEPVTQNSHELFYEKFKKFGLNSDVFAACYGMAENTYAVTQAGFDVPIVVDRVNRQKLQNELICEPDSSENAKVLVSSGVPIECTVIKIVDESGNTLGDRKIGEILIQSDCMLSGYYHRPELTEKAIIDNWYYSGDYGYIVDGNLFVTGRKKDMIIIAGKNIYPQDIDEIVSEIEGVHPGRVCAIGMFDDDSGTEKLLILAESDSDNEELINKISMEIRQKISTLLECTADVVKVLPNGWLLKSSSGKIARSANLDKYKKEFE